MRNYQLGGTAQGLNTRRARLDDLVKRSFGTTSRYKRDPEQDRSTFCEAIKLLPSDMALNSFDKTETRTTSSDICLKGDEIRVSRGLLVS